MELRVDVDIEKALIGIIVEQSLLEIGDRQLYYEVCRIMYENFKAYVPDCYEHPEYLKKVFAELDGSSYLVVADSIKSKLEEYSNIQPVRRFLEQISEIKCHQ